MLGCGLRFGLHVGSTSCTEATRTRIKGQEPISIEIAKIEFTNVLGKRKIKSKEPVVLIFDGEKHYVLDGNHRIYCRLENGEKTVLAYILKKNTLVENIVESRRRYKISACLDGYKKGALSFEELLESAKKNVVSLKV